MLNEGLYEQVISKALSSELENPEQIVDTNKIDNAEAPAILAKYIAEVVEKGLRQVQSSDISEQLKLANRIVSTVAEVTGDDEFDGNTVDERAEQLLAVVNRQNNISAVSGKINMTRPETSLASSSLFTGSLNEPSMMTELKKEIVSCNRVDMLVSFIKWSGLRLIIDELTEFTKNGGQLRVITTSYMGATDVKAIEELRKLPNTQIKISYNTKSTRLHAKSYVLKKRRLNIFLIISRKVLEIKSPLWASSQLLPMIQVSNLLSKTSLPTITLTSQLFTTQRIALQGFAR